MHGQKLRTSAKKVVKFILRYLSKLLKNKKGCNFFTWPPSAPPLNSLAATAQV